MVETEEEVGGNLWYLRWQRQLYPLGGLISFLNLKEKLGVTTKTLKKPVGSVDVTLKSKILCGAEYE